MAIIDKKLEFLKVNLSKESAHFSMVAWHVSNLAWKSENWTFRDKINWLIVVMRQNIVNFSMAYAQTKYSVLKNLNCFSDVCQKKKYWLV